MTGASFTVRPAALPDAEAIHRCLLTAFEPYRRTYTSGAFGDTVPDVDGIQERIRTMSVFVADASGEIIGTISGHDAGDGSAHIRGMAVLPEWHGQGVAAALLTEVESGLRRLGCSRVNLHTTRPLERAAHFYEKQGFVRTGEV